MTQTYTLEEVRKHNTEASLWIVVDNLVYDVTKFLAMHPGGKDPMMRVAGTDATKNFYALHRAEVLDKYARLVIGEVHTLKQTKKLTISLSTHLYICQRT